jgi:hypothetical protein
MGTKKSPPQSMGTKKSTLLRRIKNKKKEIMNPGLFLITG